MKATVRIFLQMVDFPLKYAYLHQFLKHSICDQQTRAILQKRSAEKKLNGYLKRLFKPLSSSIFLHASKFFEKKRISKGAKPESKKHKLQLYFEIISVLFSSLLIWLSSNVFDGMIMVVIRSLWWKTVQIVRIYIYFFSSKESERKSQIGSQNSKLTKSRSQTFGKKTR